MSAKILIINAGNTSTKLGLYRGNLPIHTAVIRHTDQDLAGFSTINSQKEFRESLVVQWLAEKGIDSSKLTAIGARGGILRPLRSGTYLVNELMIKDLIESLRGAHASHLSAQIGYSIAQKAGINCYIVDPITVDEFTPIARMTGHRLFVREMRTHALNMKAVARRYADEVQKEYADLSLIVVHLGTGVSVSIHRNGRMIDAVDPSQEGAFSLDRAGGLPILQVARYMDENQTSFQDFSRMVFGKGGVFSYLNTRDFQKVMQMYHEKDKEAILVVEAMAYQIAKEIGALATVARGAVDAILMTGGMAHVALFTEMITQRVSFIAPVHCYPGEDEIQALAEGVLRVLNGEETVGRY